MWTKIKPLLVLLSVMFNVAFAAAWGLRCLAARTGEEGTSIQVEDDSPIWCPLHRRIGTTEAQWREIEPKLREFRERSQALCRDMSRLRMEFIDLVAAPTPDRAAIEAKQDEIRAGQRKMQGMVAEHLLAQKQVLNADQQKRLFDLIREGMSCAGHGPMMGAGSGPGKGACRVLREGLGEQAREEPQ